MILIRRCQICHTCAYRGRSWVYHVCSYVIGRPEPFLEPRAGGSFPVEKRGLEVGHFSEFLRRFLRGRHGVVVT